MRGVFDSNVASEPAVTATGTNGAIGVESTGYIGVDGHSSSPNGAGVIGHGTRGTTGVSGISDSGVGVSGNSSGGTGIIGDGGRGTGVYGSGGNYGVRGYGGRGVEGFSDNGEGVYGHSTELAGVYGQSTKQAGVVGESGVKGDKALGMHGVYGVTHGAQSAGVYGTNEAVDNGGAGVLGENRAAGVGYGVFGVSDRGTGVGGHSTDGSGVIAQSDNRIGLHAVGGAPPPDLPVRPLLVDAPNGVLGEGEFMGVYGRGEIGVRGDGVVTGVFGHSSEGYAGYFDGIVSTNDSLRAGDGRFKIDHPLDPENKYLSHSFIQSPEMLNVYNGNTITDTNGDATVRLPDYFEALNQDFRYQLTVIGQFAQAIVAEEIRNNQFTIKTDQPNIRVSWQVTGVRKDPFANMRRIVIEEDKPAEERGLYLHPQAYGKPEAQGISTIHDKRLTTRSEQGAP
jgi:hypothetical protein